MKKMLILLSSLVLISAFASAQSKTATGRAASAAKNSPPSYCSPCLYYSGDFDQSNPNADALANVQADSLGVVAQVYSPIAPQTATVPIRHGIKTFSYQAATSASITMLEENFFGNPVGSDFVGATYDIRTMVSSGYAGNEYASGTCSPATNTDTGTVVFGFLEQFTLTCNFSVTLRAGTEYFVNILPEFNNGGYGFEGDSIDFPALNSFDNSTGGYWGNVYEASYFNSSYFGYNYSLANTVGPGADNFSLAIGGHYGK
jgi:hypothetical protein